MSALTTVLTIGIGAIIGANMRYYLSIYSIQLFGDFAYPSLLANIIGSFIAGIFLVVILEKSLLSETYRLLLLVGLCGSLTTFSAFSIETLEFLQGQNYLRAGMNILLNVVLSIAGVVLGAVLVRYFID